VEVGRVIADHPWTRPKPRGWIASAVTLGLVAGPGPAEAHLVTTGLGPVYDGLVHFALAPEDLVPALALAALAGLRGAAHGRRALFALPTAWLLGGLLGLSMGVGLGPLAPAASFLLLGGLVAADARLPLAATSALAVLLGLLHGYLNGMAMARPGLGALGVMGIVVCVFTLTALATSLVVPLRAAWARVAVRVAGSWIAAVGLLLLAWALRPGA
jgi:hydrogenase/urease accessory protein HupE